MTEGIDAITTAALGRALDAAHMRQQAISANIANHATPGYVPVRVDFAAQMDEARRTLDLKGSLDASSLADMQSRVQPDLDAQGRPVRVHLDAQMADMAANSVHFQTLARVLQKHLSLLGIAVSDGKR